MAEYIEREALLDEVLRMRNCHLLSKSDGAKVEKMVQKFPAADVVPVRHGRWAECPIADGIDQCSQCTFMVPEQNHYPYCPNCGAKMDEK